MTGVDAANKYIDFLVTPGVSSREFAADIGDNAVRDIAYCEPEFRGAPREAGIQTATYYETVPLLGVRIIVNQKSADSGVGEPIPLIEDHLSIAKPENRAAHKVSLF